MSPPASPASARDPAPPSAPLRFRSSPGFAGWLAEHRLGLAATTYQTNRLILVGVAADGARVAAFERLFDRPMGLAIDGHRLWMSGRHQLWRFEDEAPLPSHPRHDRAYVPRAAHFTGELDAHDLAVDGEGRVVFVNTLYSCLATLDEQASFAPLWRPPFITRLLPEDRCHLNGLALGDGQARYVTAVSRSDVAGGWRDHRSDGGVVLEVPSGEVVVAGLAMPHSPRLHDGRLWLLSSGTGELGFVEPGRFEPIAFLPGYPRGLALVGGFAVVGLSKPRHETFAGLPLDERLRTKEARPRCGLWVIELATGLAAHWLELEGVVSELYDVVALPGAQRPMALGLRGDELARTTSYAAGDGRPIACVLAAEEPLPHPVAPPDPRVTSRTSAASPAYAVAPLPSPRCSQLLHDYEGLTFPDLGRRAAVRALHEPLVAAVALATDGPAGLAVGEPRDDGAVIDVVSLFVRPEHRGQGLGTRLLQQLTEQARAHGATRLAGSYRTSWASREGIERLLAGAGWSAPQTRLHLARGSRETLTSLPLPAAPPLPPSAEIFPWGELGAGERARIAAQEARDPWYPAVLTPFQEEPRLEERVSVGLRWEGEVAGWLLAHRVADDTLQYTSLVVRRDLQRHGLGLALIANALRRRLTTDYAYGIFAVDPRNERMLALVERLRPRLITWSELRVAQLDLPPA